MAKQLGVGEEALAGLNDPDHHPFPTDQAAALRFAEAMTRGGGEVSDGVFAELRRHFEEPQIVEIATVVGVFNYFNRFNNALHVAITLMDPDVVLGRIREGLVSAADPRAACDRAGGILERDRRYASVALYRREGGRMVCRMQRGTPPEPVVDPGGAGPVAVAARTAKPRAGEGTPAAAGGGPAEPGAPPRLAVPVLEGGTPIGVILVQGGADPPDEEDLDLLQRVAVLLAPLIAALPESPAVPEGA